MHDARSANVIFMFNPHNKANTVTTDKLENFRLNSMIEFTERPRKLMFDSAIVIYGNCCVIMIACSSACCH